MHYDSEQSRRTLIHELVGNGTLPTTHSTDDGVGLVYRGTELVEAVSEVDGSAAFIVERRHANDGTDANDVVESRIEPRRLPTRT